MPIKSGKDTRGVYVRWGTRGKKYYYTPGDDASRKRAEGRAKKQERAVRATGWEE